MFALRTKTLVMFDRSIFKKNWQKIGEARAKRAGLYVRKTAIRLIRRDRSKSQKPSKPGRPPKTRAAGEPMRRIYSVPYGRKGGAIVGAVKLSGTSSGKPVPGLHEHGGDKTIEFIDPKKKKLVLKRRPTTEAQRKAFRKLAVARDSRALLYQMSRREKLDSLRTKKRAHYEERPFMGPALEKSLPKLPKMWAGAVR